MNDSNEAPKRRGRKPRAVVEKQEEAAKVEEQESPLPVAEHANIDMVAEASTKKVETRSERGVRVIPKGAAIDVQTDANGLAQETVYQEISLMGTSQVSKVLVVREGTFYKK